MKQSASYGAVNAAPYTRCKLDRTLATMARMGVLFKKTRTLPAYAVVGGVAQQLAPFVA